jgi:hypothetical protein
MRIFLDSCTLQALQDYGEFVFENVEPLPTNRTWDIPGHFDDLDALRSIMVLVERGSFEFALSDHSFEEIRDRGDASYLQWAHDVLDHWQACLEGSGGEAFDGSGRIRALLLDGSSFGFLGAGDRQLLRDAVELECDVFLTIEQRLPKNAEYVWRKLGIRLLRPTQLWLLLGSVRGFV